MEDKRRTNVKEGKSVYTKEKEVEIRSNLVILQYTSSKR